MKYYFIIGSIHLAAQFECRSNTLCYRTSFHIPNPARWTYFTPFL